LQSFADPAAATAGGGEQGESGKTLANSEKIYTKFDDTGEATAGRRVWKMRHRKGEFSDATRHRKKGGQFTVGKSTNRK
jgi:hypothetical protein